MRYVRNCWRHEEELTIARYCGAAVAVLSPTPTTREPVALSESEYRKGAQVISATMADDYTPPSASMDPVASASPEAAASSESAGGAATSADSSGE